MRKHTIGKLLLTASLIAGVLGLTGCHGSRGQSDFTVPEDFDTSRNYEITFWAKNDTNKTPDRYLQKSD